jgi:hypothetical protein
VAQAGDPVTVDVIAQEMRAAKGRCFHVCRPWVTGFYCPKCGMLSRKRIRTKKLRGMKPKPHAARFRQTRSRIFAALLETRARVEALLAS